MIKPFLRAQSTCASTRLRSWCAHVIAVPALALAIALPALAQSSAAKPADQAVAIELAQHKVVKGADGKEQFVDAASVKPGDIVEYSATYKNRSDKPVSGLVASLPVPGGTEYVAKSASAHGVAVEAATLDGRFGGEPLMRKAATPPGAVAKIEPVPYAEYRSLRWKLGTLAAHTSTVVKARVQVSSLTVATAEATPAAPAAAASAKR